MKSFDVVIMVVLGGMGSISGVVLAAIILTVLPEYLREPTPIFGSKVPMMLDGRWVSVQLVGLALRVSDGGELIDHLEGNEL